MKPYYVSAKAHRFAFKPFDWPQAKRDRHSAHQASQKLSAIARKMLRGQAKDGQVVSYDPPSPRDRGKERP